MPPARRARMTAGQPPMTAALLLTTPITPITSVPLRWHCCALFRFRRVVIVQIEILVSPLRIKRSRFRVGGIYANDASVLCGNWLCGGPLDFQAASSVRPRYTVPFAGFAVERFFRAWACAPLRLHFVSARPLLSPPRSNYYQGLPASSCFSYLFIQLAQGLFLQRSC